MRITLGSPKDPPKPPDPKMDEAFEKFKQIVESTPPTDPEALAARDAFFKHKEEHPEPTPWGQLTPLQRRMQIEHEIQMGIYDPNKVRK